MSFESFFDAEWAADAGVALGEAGGGGVPPPDPPPGTPSTPPSGEFGTWTGKTVAPGGDWRTYASYRGNPDFDDSRLSGELRGNLEKHLVFQSRLQLNPGQTVQLSTGGTAGYIRCGLDNGYGQVGGSERSWRQAFAEGRAGVHDIRMWGRYTTPFADAALNLFVLTHDLRFLDKALWWFEQFYGTAITHCDARETWSASDQTGTLTTRVNVNGKGYPIRLYSGSFTNTDEQYIASKWSGIRYRGHGYLGSSWRVSQGSPHKTDADFTHHTFLCLPDGTSAVDPGGNGNVWGTDQALEDALTYAVWARLLLALYTNRDQASPAGYNYARWHERARHLLFDNLAQKWKLQLPDRDYARFDGNPFIFKPFSHAKPQVARLHYYLGAYSKARGNVTAADNHLNSFLFIGEALAKDVLFIDLSEQYGESVPTFVHPHFVGRGGYGRSYTQNSPSWSSINGFGDGSTTSRQGSGNHKLNYFGQFFDAAFDLFLLRYWDTLTTAQQKRMRMRKGKDDPADGDFLWGLDWMRGTTSMMTYGAADNPADGTRGKTWKNNIHGYNNWLWNNRNVLQTLGGGSGSSSTLNLSFILAESTAFAVMFDNHLTGQHRTKFRDAINAERAVKDWSLGKSSDLIPNTLGALDHLIRGLA